MSAILGTHLIDLWRGPAPAAIKSTVELVYRPGQATAAAKVLPNQSHGSDFEATTFVAWANGHTTADGFRSSIGTVLALTYGGTAYGNVLVQDVTILNIEQILRATGIHPNGTPYDHAPAARITSRWQIVRLS
jgi:hypothetical protein